MTTLQLVMLNLFQHPSKENFGEDSPRWIGCASLRFAASPDQVRDDGRGVR